jgi:hypothetical protein
MPKTNQADKNKTPPDEQKTPNYAQLVPFAPDMLLYIGRRLSTQPMLRPLQLAELTPIPKL